MKNSGQFVKIGIKLIVKENKADIVLIGDDEKKRIVKHIAYTDCPDGE